MSYWFKDDFKDTITVEQFLKEKAWITGQHNIFTSMNPKFAELIEQINYELNGSYGNHTAVDLYLAEHYSDVEINPKYSYITSSDDIYWDTNAIMYCIDSILAENFYKYKTLLNTLSLEYNPIWNVDSEETATETRDGRTEATAYGAVTKTMTNASRNNQYTHGAEKETTKNPQVAVTEQRGAVNTTSGIQSGNKVETTTNFNTQMNDTDDWYNHDRSEKVTQPYTEFNNKGQHTDTITTPAHNVELDKDSFTDNETLGSHTDTEGTNQHTDTVTKQPYEDKTHIVRQGNIGTTTTQQMITEERELAKFSLLDVIAKDFVKALCISVYY